jgi:hypothetical protein
VSQGGDVSILSNLSILSQQTTIFSQFETLYRKGDVMTSHSSGSMPRKDSELIARAEAIDQILPVAEEVGKFKKSETQSE